MYFLIVFFIKHKHTRFFTKNNRLRRAIGMGIWLHWSHCRFHTVDSVVLWRRWIEVSEYFSMVLCQHQQKNKHSRTKACVILSTCASPLRSAWCKKHHWRVYAESLCRHPRASHFLWPRVSRLQKHQLRMRRLCEEVCWYPHLYNPSIKQYKDRQMCNNLWKGNCL